jgi:DNA-binding transcriptional MerR regulator
MSSQHAHTLTADEPASSSNKAAGAFRTISEVAEDLNVPQHVLRFWETRFFQVRPLKRGGGRRYYRPEDVALLKKIHHLLYSEGYTIKGVQKLLKGVSKAQLLKEQGVGQPGPLVNAAQVTGTPANQHGRDDHGDGAVAVAAAVVQNLTPAQRQQLEDVLAELRAMEQMLKAA